MSREWKPGDVALVEAGCWANRAVALRTGTPGNMGWAYCGSYGGKSTQNWSSDDSGIVTPIRPLAVIDPEDREQVEALIAAYVRRGTALGYSMPSRQDADRLDAMQAALREFADPKPPKPDEPLGLGAVVVDSNDVTFVRAGRLSPDGFHLHDCWRAVDGPIVGDWKRWDRIDAVRVLSEGVQ